MFSGVAMQTSLPWEGLYILFCGGWSHKATHFSFRLAVEMNVIAVRKMITLCKTFRKLDVS